MKVRFNGIPEVHPVSVEEAFALESTLANRYGGGKIPVTASVTASGSTVVYDPAPGNAVRVFWVTAITDPDDILSPLIRILIGSTEIYRGYAIAHWEVFEGLANENLVVDLSQAASVAFTAHIQEFTP